MAKATAADTAKQLTWADLLNPRLAEAQKTNVLNLSSLKFGSSYYTIDTNGSQYLAQVLQKKGHTNLTVLNLNNHQIGDDGVKYLIKAFTSQACPNLAKFSVKKNGITLEGIKVIEKFLESEACSNLVMLDISSNYDNKQGNNEGNKQESRAEQSVDSYYQINKRIDDLMAKQLQKITKLKQIEFETFKLPNVFLDDTKIIESVVELSRHAPDKKTIDLTGLPGSKLETMSHAFKYCSNATQLIMNKVSDLISFLGNRTVQANVSHMENIEKISLEGISIKVDDGYYGRDQHIATAINALTAFLKQFPNLKAINLSSSNIFNLKSLDAVSESAVVSFGEMVHDQEIVELYLTKAQITGAAIARLFGPTNLSRYTNMLEKIDLSGATIEQAVYELFGCFRMENVVIKLDNTPTIKKYSKALAEFLQLNPLVEMSLEQNGFTDAQDKELKEIADTRRSETKSATQIYVMRLLKACVPTQSAKQKAPLTDIILEYAGIKEPAPDDEAAIKPPLPVIVEKWHVYKSPKALELGKSAAEFESFMKAANAQRAPLDLAELWEINAAAAAKGDFNSKSTGAGFGASGAQPFSAPSAAAATSDRSSTSDTHSTQQLGTASPSALTDQSSHSVDSIGDSPQHAADNC